MTDQRLQHYRPEESQFIRQVDDWLQSVQRTYRPYLTDFLTPRQQFIVRQIVSPSLDFDLAFEGLAPQAERCRAIIYPNYEGVGAEDFQLSLLEIDYPAKFASLSHGQILGTLLSQGIDRQVVGDILTDGQRWQVIVDRQIGSILCQTVTQISRVGVRLTAVEWEQMVQAVDDWQEKLVYSSSLRLDTLIGNVYNFSRQHSKQLIESDKVQLNFAICSRPFQEIEVEDLISVRGFGRFKLKEIEGRTRKENYRLNIQVLESRKK